MELILGNKRFDLFIEPLAQLLTQSLTEADPVNFLYQKDARSYLFRLEALSRIYKGILDKKTFEKLRTQFKNFEDALGAYDYYIVNYKQLSTNTNIPKIYMDALEKKIQRFTKEAEQFLKKEGWLQPDLPRIAKIKSTLQQVNWVDENTEVPKTDVYLHRQIKKINELFDSYKGQLKHIEGDLHELRRKLRWLSIYPQAIHGAIQYGEPTKPESYQVKYETPQIVNSPYNVFPKPEWGESSFILLNKNCFLALSWMINELGVYKDRAQNFLLLAEIIKKTDNTNKSDAEHKAADILNSSPTLIIDILDQASMRTKVFFAEKNLDKLIQGESTA